MWILIHKIIAMYLSATNIYKSQNSQESKTSFSCEFCGLLYKPPPM